MDEPIYVVVASDDLNSQMRASEPTVRKPNPIVFETNVIGATFAKASARAGRLEHLGYGPCRVARLVFEDLPPTAGGAGTTTTKDQR